MLGLKLFDNTAMILDRYGKRSGSIINSTGTGTQVVLSMQDTALAASNSDIFGEKNQLVISAFSSAGRPLLPRAVHSASLRRTLSGKVLATRHAPLWEIDITVIGNSLDYYKLAMLSRLYTSNDGSNPSKPWLRMQIVPHSAPGAEVMLSDGFMTDSDPVFGIDGNSKASDKTFSFSFSSIDYAISYSKQLYDPSNSPTFLTDMVAY